MDLRRKEGDRIDDVKRCYFFLALREISNFKINKFEINHDFEYFCENYFLMAVSKTCENWHW